MSAVRSILKLTLLLLSSLSLISASSLTLELPDIWGAGGQTVGWGFTLEGDEDYWLVITSVQSTFDGSGSGVSATDPAVTDYLSYWFLDNSYALAPGATLQQTFVAGSTGLGSVQLLPGLPGGSAEWGGLFVTYDLYDGDPFQGAGQVFPTTDPGFFWLDASVTVYQGHTEVPEPSTALFLAGGLVLLLFRKKWSFVRLGVFVAVATTGWGQQDQCAQMSTNVLLRAEDKTGQLGDIRIYCNSAPVTGTVSVKVQLQDHVGITNRFVDAGLQKTDAVAESQNTVNGVVSPGTPDAIEFHDLQFNGNEILITKIRADIHSVAASSGGTYGMISAKVTVAFANGNEMELANNPSLVGTFISSVVGFSLMNSSSEDSISQITLKQCDGSNSALALNPESGVPVAPSFHVRVQENFGNGIRNKTDEGILPGEPGTGTRVRVLFENVPDGLQLFTGVKDKAPDYSGDPEDFETPARLHLIDHDETLSGTSAESLPLLSPTNTAAGGIRPLRAMGSGKFMGVWENIGKGTYVPDVLDLPIYAAFPANGVQGTLPANIQLSVSLAPQSEDGHAGSDIVPRFSGQTTFQPIRIESCACSTRLLSRLSMKSGPLTNRQWTLTVTNIGGTPVENGSVKPQITKVAGPGTATLLGTELIELPTISPGGSVQVAVPLSFSETSASSRFTLKTDLEGGCFTGTASILNQVP